MGCPGLPLLLFLAILCSGCASTGSGEAPSAAAEMQPAGNEMPRDEEQWGIRIRGLTLSAAGYMLDFRYEVTDPEKAGYIVDPLHKAYLHHHRTGAILIVPRPPKIGSLKQRSAQPIKGRTYFILFANPGGLVKPGDRADIAVGDATFEDLVVLE